MTVPMYVCMYVLYISKSLPVSGYDNRIAHRQPTSRAGVRECMLACLSFSVGDGIGAGSDTSKRVFVTVVSTQNSRIPLSP